jgi:hypothetical protein
VTNCRWGGSDTSAIPFYDQKRQFRELQYLKKLIKRVPLKVASSIAKGNKSLLNVKWICPIHAEQVQ